jgi:hypothetical protein
MGRLDLLFCFRLGSELLLHLEGNGIGIYFVGGSRFAQNNGGIGASRCQKNSGLHQQTRERTLIGTTDESSKEFADGVRFPVLSDAVLPRQGLEPPFVQERSNLVEDELQITLEETYRNGCADGAENANSGRVGDSLFSAPLLLLCFPFPIVAGVLGGMMDGASGIAAHLAKLTLLVALGDDGFAGEFAGLELGPLRLLFRGRLLGTNLGVLVARECGATFLLLAVGRTNLNQLRFRGNGFGNMRLDLRLITGGVGTLCGIRETGKCFLRARHGGASRLRSAHQGEGMNHGAGDWII